MPVREGSMPIPDSIRSAIVMFETESGSTFQVILTREVEVSVETDVEYDPWADVFTKNPYTVTMNTYTVTITAREMFGQLRVPTSPTVVQAGSPAIGGEPTVNNAKEEDDA